MKHKGIISVFIAITLIISFVPAVFAGNGENPVFYLTFETLAGGRIQNFASAECNISLANVNAYTNGYRGLSASIGASGSVKVGSGQLGNMLSGKEGMSFSAYVKLNEPGGGNLLTLHSRGEEKGISIQLSDSEINVLAKADTNENLKSAHYLYNKSLSEWTHVLVSINFKTGIIKFYIDGEFKKSQSAAFIGKKFLFEGASAEDIIGDSGMLLDEVRIHDYAVSCSAAKAIMEEDAKEPEELPYVDILADNLVAGFSFDEGEGNTTTSKGQVVTTATLDNTEWEDGVRNTGLRFHPSERSMVTIGNDVLEGLKGASGLTVSGWFYVNDNPNVPSRIMALNIEGTKAALHLTYGASSFQVAARSCPTDALQGRSYRCAEFGKWIFVTISADYQKNTLKCYVNGKEIVSTLGNAEVSFSQDYFSRSKNAQPSTIGGDPTTAYYNQSFGGILDEWNIYNRAITDEEAAYIYVDYGKIAPREVDQQKYDILDSLSDNNAIFAVGMNEAIYRNKRNRLDWNNINATPYIHGDTLMLPVKFFTDTYGAEINWEEENKKGSLTYQGTEISFDTESTVYTVNGNKNTLSVTPVFSEGTFYLPFRFVFESFGKYVYYNENGLVAAGDKNAICEKFSDEAYVNWTKYALCELPYRQPTVNHAASRVQIAHSDMAGGSNLCYASPSIAKLPDGTLVVSHDAYVYGGSSAGAYIYRSEDNGKTWKHTADLTTMMGNIFELNGNLYLMGVQKGNPVITIQKSTDGGFTWTEAVDSTTGLIENDKVIHAHCAPTPVVIANGRIYRAYESINSEGWTRGYCALIASASINSDLLNASSWTITDPVQLNLNDIPEGVTTHVPGWLEGNAVVGPNGEILNIIRVNFEPDFGYAAVLKLSSDNKTLTFDRFIDFDGGMTKFVVRRDEQTGKYISLVNNITNIDYAKQRTVLSLAVSDDAYNWEIKETLLYPNELNNWENIILTRAFQYVDWIIDGDDILYVVREAGEGAPNYHDALDITFYRLENFRKYL